MRAKLSAALFATAIVSSGFGFISKAASTDQVRCKDALDYSIDLSSGLTQLVPASKADMQSHVSARVPLGFERWAETAAAYGFGGPLHGLRSSNIPVTRDGVPIGRLGLSESGKAVLIYELLDSKLAVQNKLEPYFLRWQKRLIESGVLKPGFGWFSQGEKIYLVRELLSGKSIHAFGRFTKLKTFPQLLQSYSLGKLRDQDRFQPELTLSQMRQVERILRLNLDHDQDDSVLVAVPTRIIDVFMKQSDAEGVPTDPRAIKWFLNFMNWVFTQDGRVLIDGLLPFTGQIAGSDNPDDKLKEYGLSVSLAPARDLGFSTPTLDTWTRFVFALYLSNEDAKAFLQETMAVAPESAAKLQFLQLIWMTTRSPRLNPGRHDVLTMELFGGARRVQGLIGSRIAFDHDVPYPRPTELEFASKAKFRNHQRHAVEFGLKSGEEYLAYAREKILSSPSAESERRYVYRKDGDIVVWNSEEEWFAIFHPSGVLKTFFRPNPKYKNFSVNQPYFTDHYYYLTELVNALGED